MRGERQGDRDNKFILYSREQRHPCLSFTVIPLSKEHDKATSPHFHSETRVTTTKAEVLGLSPLQVSGPSPQPGSRSLGNAEVNTP